MVIESQIILDNRRLCMKRYSDYKRRDSVCSIQIGPLTSPCQAHMACSVHILLLLAGSLRKPTRISLTCYHCSFPGNN